MSIESGDPAVNQSPKVAWWTPRLAGPVIAAAVVRFTLLAVALARSGTSAISQGDTNSYLEPGRNLLMHGRFVAYGFPDVLRTPGYSLFLAITSIGGMSIAAAVNVLLSVFGVVLVWRLGQRVFADNRIALIAAWIFACEPIAVANSVLLMSDTLFLALFLLSLERLVDFLRGHHLRVLAAAGLWLAAATFVRPITYYLPVALALGLFLALVRVPGLRWKAPAVLLISVLPWLAAWQIRNRIETGYGGFSSAGEYNLYFNDSAEVKARVEHRGFYAVREQFGYSGALGSVVVHNHSQQQYLYPTYLAVHREQTGWSQGQRIAFLRSEALHIIREHYGIYLRSCIITRLFEEIFNPGAGHFDHLLNLQQPAQNDDLINMGPIRSAITLAREHPWMIAEKVAFEFVLLGLYLFAVRGIIRGGLDSACLWLLMGTSIYFLVVSVAAGGPGAEARYRLPIMPVICLLAAAGLRGAKEITHRVVSRFDSRLVGASG